MIARLWLRLIHYVASRTADARWIHLYGKLYLERFILRGGREQDGGKVNIYLHRFHQPDDDRGPHCHPWEWSFSVILWGGYVETRAYCSPDFKCAKLFVRELGMFSVNRIDSKTFHRVAKLLPRDGEVWTLFVTGPKHGRSWGYQIPGVGYVSRRDAMKEPGLECNGCPYGVQRCVGRHAGRPGAM